MVKTYLLLLFLFTAAGISQAKKCFFTAEFGVRFINQITKNDVITVRCRSKDDDLGFHSINYFKYYDFSFCDQIFGATLFACDLKWGKKKASFHGFDSSFKFDCPHNVCQWIAKSDGIYFVKESSWVKSFNWTT